MALLGDILSWREARRIIEAHGGQVRVVLVPGVVIGDIPEGAALALQAASNQSRVVRTREQAETTLGRSTTAQTQGAGGALSTEARAALQVLAPMAVPLDQNPLYRVLPGGQVEVRPISDWELPPHERPQPTRRSGVPDGPIGNAIGNTFNNTSDFLAGDVGVGILRPESNGVSNPNVENWTPTEVTNSLAALTTALNKLVGDSPRGKVTFVVRTEQSGPVADTVECNYEAHSFDLPPVPPDPPETSNFQPEVVLDVLGRLGYPTVSVSNSMLSWANDIRSDLGTDWAYGIFIIDNSSATANSRASAFLNGPAAWLFQNYTYNVYHHEMGHSWGALDEYHPDAGNSPTVMIGYTQEPDANSMCCTPAHVAANPALAPKATGFFDGAGEGINALMAYNIDYISPWTRGAWGTWDLDGDGINETQDTFPVVTLNAPSGTTTLVFTGNATASTLIRETGAFADANISVNKIVSVEWRMNGGPWQNATAADGTFDESIEDYTFTTPLLRNGPYVFEARARDNFGNASTFYPRRLATASGSAASNNVPMAALSVTPTLGSTATAFQLSAAGSVDAEDSTSLQYRWDFENDSVFDTGFSSSPTITHSYATPGTKTAKVEVRDSAGVPLTTTRLVTFTVQAPNVVPTATFTVDKGALFSATPAVFNFDASGVVDGEDATAALQVRWDFEDDGVFDTTFSTTKTVSHDYAQDFLMNVAFEPALETSLYCCQTPPNVVTGYAQGFVAATSGIGKAAIKIGHYGDTTPGGTCEVGIKSSLAGAFLTSVIKNQTSIVDFDWNTFDFPDISVTIGGSYFIVMLCSDWDIMWQSRRNTEPDYPDGVHWYYLSSSATWFSNASFDHVFRIYDSALTTVPLTKSKSWRVRIEVRDSALQTAQTVRDIWTNAYDTPPTVSLASDAMTGTTATTFNLTATGSDVDSATTWDGLLHYRWDTNGDGNYETEFAATNTRAQSFPQPGIYQATVEVRDRYHATARSTVPLTVEAAGQASKILYSVGDGQSAAINTAVAIDPTVVVRDASSAIVTGAVVVFTVVTGGGTLTEATQTTDGFGIATLGAWTLGGVPGANSIKATLPAFPGPSVTFNATGTAPPPVVTTLAATSIGVTGATLNASINPNGSATMAVFDYGTTTGYGSTTSGTGLGSGSSPVPHSAAISGLTCATEYHFRARASNGGGSTNGSDLAFTTAACPARVFVSVVGVDTNDCSDIATPCRTLNAAIGQVAVDGEVIVIKSGSYAGASITKGVKIDAASGVVAFSGQAVTVNAPGAKVVVRGLTLKAITPGTGTGLLIQNAAAVFVENTVIDGWGFGIQHAVAEVFIKDSTFRSNDTGIWAMGGNTTIDTSRFTNNSIGLATDIGVVSLRGATVSGNNIGIHADASAVVTVEKCQIANNSTGVRVTNDPSVTLRLSRSVVTGNFVGLENLGGTLYVYGNNAIRGNTTNTSGTITTTGLQ